jgi:hypothetical protein
MRSLAASLLGVVLAFGPFGCGPTGGGDDVVGDGGHQTDGPIGTCYTEGSKQCDLTAWQTCQNGKWVTSVNCPLSCDPTLGCVECVPGSTSCQGNDVVSCGADGHKGTVPIAHCQTSCSSGTCSDPCGQAEVNKSYLGCDYYPTVTMNSQLDTTLGFSFAVAVAAPATNGGAATITITGGALTTTMTDTVAPGTLKQIKLPWVTALKQDYAGGAQAEASVLMANGAYHLVSTQPVTVYQFNALEYEVSASYSYTNDASLLLPRHTWADSNAKSSYIVMARPTMEIGSYGSKLWSPGMFAVVGSEDGTQVTIKFTANTLAGSSGVQAYTAGSTGTFALNKGTVLMIASGHNDSCTGPTDANGYTYCDLASGYDLTGTEIEADKPVGVFGGHNCDFIPFDKWACDHLEEQLFPLTAWGKHYVGAKTISATDPNLWRVVSGDSANLIQFNPPVLDKITNQTIGQVTLDKGKWLEFITDQDFEAQGDSVFMMAGFMVGQNYSNLNPGEGAPGDPAMSLAVPVEQFRKSYTFLAPESYTQNYLTIIAKVGSTVTLDNNAITDFTAVGSGDWGVKKFTINNGTHTITTDGTDGFGIMVYGVGSYTSYMYPGGLDVKEIYVPG